MPYHPDFLYFINVKKCKGILKFLLFFKKLLFRLNFIKKYLFFIKNKSKTKYKIYFL